MLTALTDSETALNRYAAATSQLADLDAARAASAKALELARQRYRAGEDDLLNLLDAQSDYSVTDQAPDSPRRPNLRLWYRCTRRLGAAGTMRLRAPAHQPRNRRSRLPTKHQVALDVVTVGWAPERSRSRGYLRKNILVCSTNNSGYWNSDL